jgi:hypothetical protein
LPKATVEFLGPVRLATNLKEVEVPLADRADLQDIAHFLCESFPKLIGRVFNSKTLQPKEPYRFSVNGRSITKDMQLRISDGDRIMLVSIDSGG